MEDSLSAGTLLARRYRLIDPIGAGGMSVIWRARDEVLDRVVALKVLAPELAADQRFRDLVREEARSAAQLVHPHVTSVHDYGEMIAPDGAVTAFVVMELLSGESLEGRLTAGALPWPEALEICGQVAEALAAAHRIGVVHRDVTPGNIMLTSGGVKVLDFGIATRIGEPDEDDGGDTFGTPAYVAPERLDGTPTQPATDTYALGVLLFETLTGRVPFPAVTWEDLSQIPRHGTPPAPTGVAGLPDAVAQLCRRCLSRSPLERPTAAQVAEVLAANRPEKTTEPVPAAPPREVTVARRTEAAQRAFLPGTAVARTVAARSDHERGGWARVAIAVAAAVVVLATAGVVAMALRQTGRTANQAGAGTPATTVSPTPAVQLPLAAPKPQLPRTTPSRSRSVSPTGAPKPTVGETLTAINQIIEDGLDSKDIRPDAGVDLQNQVQNLQASLGQGGTVNVASEAANLRNKLDARKREGAIIGESADLLEEQIAKLAVARV